MQTPTIVLNIGADVAKDEIVVACSEGSFPVRKLANQRTAVMPKWWEYLTPMEAYDPAKSNFLE